MRLLLYDLENSIDLFDIHISRSLFNKDLRGDLGDLELYDLSVDSYAESKVRLHELSVFSKYNGIFYTERFFNLFIKDTFFLNFFLSIFELDLDISLLTSYKTGELYDGIISYPFLWKTVKELRPRRNYEKSKGAIYYYDIFFNVGNLYNIRKFRRDIVFDYYYFNHAFFRMWFYRWKVKEGLEKEKIKKTFFFIE